MHRLLTTLSSNNNAAMNALGIMQRLVAGFIMLFGLNLLRIKLSSRCRLRKVRFRIKKTATLTRFVKQDGPLVSAIKEWRTKPQECFREIWEAAEKLYGDLIPLSQNIFRQIKTSSVPKEYIENYLQTVWKTFLENVIQ
ncbi:hypothetical protein Tsp_10208 [Trichinella spiralis]|uniref:hypothetical protein n=1 Tax=Trichinella spiralis TaxID=6334 RepID=UPI0001EFDDEB|nr:hypothetical protein Tsp_10208 [Trichinella spiralis]